MFFRKKMVISCLTLLVILLVVKSLKGNVFNINVTLNLSSPVIPKNIKSMNNQFKCTCVFEAIKNGNLEEVESFLDKNPQFFKDNYNSENNAWTPLHEATCYDQKEIVELLISRGADVNTRDNKGKTPLHYAVEKENKYLVELLISKGAELNIRDNKGKTPLHYAVEKENKSLTELLISKGADINIKDNDGKTPLSSLIGNFQKKEIPSDNRLETKSSDIFEAIGNGNLSDVKKLVEKNPAILKSKHAGKCYFSCNNIPLWTPLHDAVYYNDMEIIEFLLSKGADIEARGERGITPLHRAIWEDHKELVAFLIDKGSDIEAKDDDNTSSLHRAAWLGKDKIVEFLVSKGADVNSKNYTGSTPFHEVPGHCSDYIAGLLLEKGAHINARGGTQGGTALHGAVYYNRYKLAEFLISKGADVNVEDYDGKTPLKLAIYGGKDEIAKLLRKYGGKE